MIRLFPWLVALAVLIVLVLVFGLPARGVAPPPVQAPVPSIASEVLAPYVEVRQDDTLGSGVVIRHEGKLRVLTCSHVAAGEGDITLRKECNDGRTIAWDAKLLRRTPIKDDVTGIPDLALLEPASDKGLTACRFASSLELEAGEACWYVGTPAGFHRSLERSIINRPLCKLHGGLRTVVNGNGWYGSSGGPLFVRRQGHYALAGIVSCLQRAGDQRTPLGCESHAAIRAFLRAK